MVMKYRHDHGRWPRTQDLKEMDEARIELKQLAQAAKKARRRTQQLGV